ncbi:hypothetical protein ASPZODRAFT_142330 [Penicilliopsis zonata CBS 506.65]|uniref:Peptidase S9 prolyl oligopeptidase catalytic domain-containing protein n=1 Tax=Penicilliopsis zonata CBS 506.65 TaxID=1073090 RepID=A0A1L9SHE8_9EURO|nr:hypothetical protein ASPZODRAFT_142330 [Penicilliopsis zonata CBS 506.65]OJJ46516.1 hypothetical protein ASPZODRAFT_142330 [Penicilliopsis zonata CBS 506.65]
MAQTAAYGSWASPITADMLTQMNVTLSDVAATSDGSIYVSEGRPFEGGRNCIVKYSEGVMEDALPKEYDARSRVHEYGGKGMTASATTGQIVFTDVKTSGLYLLDSATGSVDRLTAPSDTLRYVCTSVRASSKTGKIDWILAVEEDHTKPAPADVRNTVVAINVGTKQAVTLLQGADFYSYAHFSPDGTEVCWVQWNHPDMPWTGTLLWTARWADGGELSQARQVAGKAQSESITQPRYGPDGTLYFVGDRTGFWQLYRLPRGSSQPTPIPLKGLEEAEFAGPDWFMGNSTYTCLTSRQLVAAYVRNAQWSFILVDLDNDSYRELNVPITDQVQIAECPLSDTSVAVLASSSTSVHTLYTMTIGDTAVLKAIKKSSDLAVPETVYSIAQHISFPRVHGTYRQGECHAVFLPPHNPEYQAPQGTLPPVVVSLHGGPTSHSGPGLSLADQYWTTRGYAIVWVNYGGSSGYGRAYRDLLNARWGELDIADTASCISYMASSSRIDGTQVGICGGSAGGYGVLQALCDYPELIAGGASLYGIANLRTLCVDTHKFESHYAYNLLFPPETSEEDREKVFNDRSPCYHADRIRAPLLLLQGEDDNVVPLSQAQDMEKVMLENHREVKLVVFKGEGHGFRQAASKRRVLDEEEEWWKKNLLKTEV